MREVDRDDDELSGGRARNGSSGYDGWCDRSAIGKEGLVDVDKRRWRRGGEGVKCVMLV